MSRIENRIPKLALVRWAACALVLASVPLLSSASGWVGVGRAMKEDTRSVAFGAVTGGDGFTHYYAFSGHKHYGVFRSYSTAYGAAWGPWQPTSLDEYVLYVAGANSTGASAQVNVVVTGGEYLTTPVVLAGTSNGKVYRSVDHGVTWTPASGLPDSAIMDLCYTGSRVLAATAGYGIYRSLDHGITFSPLAPPMGTNPFMKIEPEPGSPNFFAVTAKTGEAPNEVSGGVFYWNGAGWQDRSTGLPGWGSIPPTIYSFTAIEAVDPVEDPPPQVLNTRLWLGDMNGSGVLLSGDLGASWTHSCLSCDAVTCLTVAPDYTAANEHLFIGTTWGWYEHAKVDGSPQCSRRLPKGLAINSVTADPTWNQSDPTLWLATSDGIRYLAPGDFPAPPESDDELSSFDISFLNPSPHVLEDASLFAASRQFGVFRSLDRGATFHQYMPPLEAATSGATGVGEGTPVTALALSPEFHASTSCSGDGATVYMATDGRGVFRSAAAGSQWETINVGLLAAGSLRVSHLVHNPASLVVPYPYPLFAGLADQARVVRYFDDGSAEYWVAPLSNPGGTATTALALPPNHNGITQQGVFAGTDAGLFRSNNLGDDWTDELLPGTGPVTAIAFSPDYNGTTDQTMFAARAGSGLYRKINEAGWRWEPVAGVTDASVTALAVSDTVPWDGALAVATGNAISRDVGGVFISTDGGATFLLQVNGLQDRQVRSLALVRLGVTSRRLVAGVQRQRSFYCDAPFSLTQSPTWQLSTGFESTTGEIRAVATGPSATNIGCPETDPLAQEGGDLFIGGTKGVFWSNDSGETFRPLNQWLSGDWVCPPTVNALFAFINPNGPGGVPVPMLLAGTEDSVTTDGGVWYRWAVLDTATGVWDWTQGVWVRSPDLTGSITVRHFTRERTLSPIVIRAATDVGTFVSDQTVTTCGVNWVFSGLSGDITDIRNGQTTGGLKIPNRPDAPSGSITWGTVSNSGVYRGVESGTPLVYSPSSVTWYERNGSGLGFLPSLNARSVIQLSDMTLLCGTQGAGVFRSEDEGEAWWEESVTGIGGLGKPVTDFLESTNGDVLCAVDSSASGGGVFLSGDEGRHWASISEGFDSTDQSLAAIVATSDTPPVYYAGTYSHGSYATTITAKPYPTVTGLSVSSGPSTGGTTVVVTGTDFQDACPSGYTCPHASAVVVFGGQDASTTYDGSTQLTATTPAHPGGPVEVWVRNPDTRAVRYAGTFTFTEVEGGEPEFKMRVETTVVDLVKRIRVYWENAPGSGATKLFRSPTRDFSQAVTVVPISGTSGGYTFLDATATDGYRYYYKVE